MKIWVSWEKGVESNLALKSLQCKKKEKMTQIDIEN